jgi:hypothetical protein
MRRRAVIALAVAAALLGSPGCAFHHVWYEDAHRHDFIDWEPDATHWGEHYHYGDHHRAHDH